VNTQEIRTYVCAGCGAGIATSAPPGSSVECPYCGTPFRVPLVTPPVDSRGDDGQTPGASAPPTTEYAPAADEPRNAETQPARTDRDSITTQAPPPDAVAARSRAAPLEDAPPGSAPEAPDLAREAPRDEPIVVPPERVRVIPTTQARRGTASRRARGRTAMLLAGAVFACCLVPAGIGLACALTGLSPDLFIR
jgi:DNA-directed RNA polymerase subunit RPC12/RpoP